MCLSPTCQLEDQCQPGNAAETIGLFANAIPLVMGISFVIKYLYALFWGFQVGTTNAVDHFLRNTFNTCSIRLKEEAWITMDKCQASPLSHC